MVCERTRKSSWKRQETAQYWGTVPPPAWLPQLRLGIGRGSGSAAPAMTCGTRAFFRVAPHYNHEDEAPMNVQPRVQMDKDAFLAWVQGREGRFELVERRVVVMVGGSKTHALIASQLMRALWARIDATKWVVLGSDLAVDVGPDSLHYPDAIVDCIGGQRALVATAPVLIAEVLSPSSAMLDLGDKAAEYLRLAEPRDLSRSVAGRDQGVGLCEGVRAASRTRADPRGGCDDQRSGARDRPSTGGDLSRGRVRRSAMQDGRLVAVAAIDEISDG
jgi:hypothetical protein